MGLAWHMVARPEGLPKATDFELREFELPPLRDGMMRVRNRWLSIDPHTRIRMDAALPFAKRPYVPHEIGEALDGSAVGEVVESRAEGFAPGDLVNHYGGWRDEAALTPAECFKLPTDGIPEQSYIGLLGHTGATAYFGLRVTEPKAGETIFVSGASGAVGSTVVQLAKLKGMTVIGSAGGEKKCDMVRALGADFALDYKAGPILDQLDAAAPDGIDVYFDNVGGDHLDAAMATSRAHARFATLGTMENYNSGNPAVLHHLLNVTAQGVRIQGVNAINYIDEFPAFRQELTGLIKAGRLSLQETIREGLEMMPSAFLELFTGGSFGKMLIKL